MQRPGARPAPDGAGRPHRLTHGLMLVATLAWAGNIVAVKKGLVYFGPLALTQLRVCGAALVIGAMFFAWRRRPPIRLGRREWFRFALMALFGTTLNQLFFIGGLNRTSVSHTGLIVALGPVMVLILSCLLRLEALTFLKTAGMLISFVGVAILTVGKAGKSSGGHWSGDLILLAGTAVFAYYTILVKEVSDRYDALTLNALTYGLGALFIVPFGTAAVLKQPWAGVASAGWWCLGYTVVFGSVIPYLLYAVALSELTASRVAAFSYLQPVIATAFALWLLAEKLTLGVVAGGVLILLGVYLTERERGEAESAIRNALVPPA